MSLQSAFDFAKPFDIMVGHWVGTSSTYDPAGTYLFSSKSYVSVYWKDDNTLSFRESGEDDMEYGRPGVEDFVNPRTPDGIKRIGQLLSTDKSKSGGEVENSSGLRRLTYDFTVTGAECHTNQNADISVTGRRTRPDSYQFHVKKKKTKPTKSGKLLTYYHHVFNSHHLASPEDWHIIGPVVGPVWKNADEVSDSGDEKVGLSVVQFFRRISYSVPEHFISALMHK